MTTRAEAPTARATSRPRAELVSRAIVVLGLVADTVVHLMLAPVMQVAAPGGVGGGTLFRAQAVVAAVVALLLLVTGRRWAYALALLAALSALGPVLLYHFVDVPPIGPVPRMHDPFWSPEKVVSVAGEALAAIFAVVGLRQTGRGPGTN
ncbi:hypothetical protein GCM10009584_19540 [Ornithinimicrobium humiphilum]|uniref:Integral membrane protein n=1 Tax=Ornithinimicrobium humiphilum TaxID=125288 RepID=A0A543KLV0_9MICO|nr:hypothetical protein [Ornithinimicrobium humiphilum]TQM96040.1 hypothetical protein FB476_0893 [Ornithinimicrobium humiphilum]